MCPTQQKPALAAEPPMGAATCPLACCDSQSVGYEGVLPDGYRGRQTIWLAFLASQIVWLDMTQTHDVSMSYECTSPVVPPVLHQTRVNNIPILLVTL